MAAGTWSNLQGPVGDLVEMLVTGAFGRLDLLAPILLGAMAVRGLILYPERPDANGRIVIGLSAWSSASSARSTSRAGRRAARTARRPCRTRRAGRRAASKPLIFMMGEVLAVPLLVLLTVFGLLVVTATPVNAIPRRLRQLGVRLGIVEPAYEPGEVYEEDDERYDEQWREALPAGTRLGRRAPPGPRRRRRPLRPRQRRGGGAHQAQEAPSARRSARDEPAHGRGGRGRGRRCRARRGRAQRHAALAGRRRPDPGRLGGHPRARTGTPVPGARDAGRGDGAGKDRGAAGRGPPPRAYPATPAAYPI
ncbi:hypothetical protein SMICM304S_07573 [Streptomyces microflavus]